MSEDKKDNSMEKSFAGILTPEAQKHPIFRTQSEKDKLDFVFDKEVLTDVEDIRNGNKEDLRY